LRRVFFAPFKTVVTFAETILADTLTSFAKVFGDLYLTAFVLLVLPAEESAGYFSGNQGWSYVVSPMFTR
jgi:hypothetical protein